MIYDYENKTLQVKIVYYGPAMSGKTASIKNLFSYFNKEDTLSSIDSTIGRTLFFDFGVLEFEGAEWSLKFLMYSATGQDFYASTRPATLNGVDGIIFVADSRAQCLQHNIRFWNELETLFGEEFQTLPIVVSFNKQDLPDKINPGEFLKTIDSSNFSNLAYEQTNAINGEGILDSFKKLVEFIFPNLSLF
ncbi:MAG: GTP-binding protein [Promethearchaeota archaeon]